MYCKHVVHMATTVMSSYMSNNCRLECLITTKAQTPKKAKLESYYFSKTLIQLTAEIFKKKKKKNTEIIKFYSHN